MLLKDINPYVRIALCGKLTRLSSTETFKTLVTPDCRLFLITDGSGEFRINGIRRSLSKHDCIIFQSGTQYEWRPEKNAGLSYYAINFDYTQNFAHIKHSFHPKSVAEGTGYAPFEKIEFEDAVCLNSPLVIKNAIFIEDRLRSAVTEFLVGGDFSAELLSALLKSVIIGIVRRTNESCGGLKPFEIRTVIDYIQKNYMYDISNEDIARRFGFNASYLSRKFKKHMGCSLHSFIVRYRVSAAEERLRSQNVSVSEAAALCGFSDVYYFSRCFKKLAGVSPSRI